MLARVVNGVVDTTAALDKELLVIMSRHTKENKMGLDSCLFIIVSVGNSAYSKYGL